MPDNKTEPLAPIAVTIIGTGTGTPDPPTGSIATTEGAHVPNLIVTIVTPLMAIAIRFGNTYLTILVGLVAAGMTSNIIPATDFTHLVWECAKLSIAGAGVGLLKDLVTVFGKLEGKFPLATGNV